MADIKFIMCVCTTANASPCLFRHPGTCLYPRAIHAVLVSAAAYGNRHEKGATLLME